MGNLARPTGKAGGRRGNTLLSLLALAIGVGATLMIFNDWTTLTTSTPSTNSKDVKNLEFTSGVSGNGWVNGKITPALFGISITCEWIGDDNVPVTKTTTTLNGLFTCSNADVAWWSDSVILISAWVTGFEELGDYIEYVP